MRDIVGLSAANSAGVEKAFLSLYKKLQKFTAYTIYTELGKKDIDESKIDELATLLKKSLDLFGYGCLQINTSILGNSNPSLMPILLEKVGSEELVLSYANNHNRVSTLFENKYCRSILETNMEKLIYDSKIPCNVLTDTQIRKILHSKHINYEQKKYIIEDALKLGKLSEPIDLLKVISILGKEKKHPYFLEQKLEEEIGRQVESLTSDNDKSAVREFWYAQLLEAGFVPKEFEDTKDRTTCLEILEKFNPRVYCGLVKIVDPIFRNSIKVAIKVAGRLPSITHFNIRLSSNNNDIRDFLSRIEVFPKISNDIDNYLKSIDEIHGKLTSLDLTIRELLAVARNGNDRAIGELLRINYFDNLENVSSFWREQHGVTGNYDRDNEDISSSFITGFIGPTLTKSDFIFYRYLQQTSYKDLDQLSLKDTIKWLNTYMPHSSDLRDLLLTKVWLDKFEKTEFDYDTAITFLNLFTETSHRRELFAKIVYDKFLDGCNDIASASRFIQEVYPLPSVKRDALYEDALNVHSFTPSQFAKEVAPFLSTTNRQYLKNQSIFDGTIGSAIDNWSLDTKRQVFEWLFLEGIKPNEIINLEKQLYCRLDELVSFIKEPTLRNEAIKKLCFGANGLASNRELTDFNILLEKVLDRSIEQDGNLEKSSIEKFVRECIKTTILESSIERRERLINKLVELTSSTEHMSAEEFIARWLSAHSPAMVKGLQIIASRKEKKDNFPKLYEAAKDCKSDAPSMSVLDAMKAILRNKSLVEKDPEFLGQIGSASIKAVYRARFGNETKVIKVKHVTAEKDLEAVADEIGAIYDKLKPVLTGLFQIETFPQIDQRVANAIRSELDFEEEIANSNKLSETLASIHTRTHATTPTVQRTYCDRNIIVEDLATGHGLSDFLAQNPSQARAFSRNNQELFLKLIRQGIVLADLHSGNQFVENAESITIIDTGSIFWLSENETRLFLKITQGIASPIFSEKILISAFNELLGDRYDLNKDLIDRELKDLSKLSASEKALGILSLFEKIPDFYLPDSIYWSVLGLTKPYGLDSFHITNIFEYFRLLNSK